MEKLVNIKNGLLAVLAVCGSAIAQALGGWDVALKVLVGLMAADYVTGLLVAAVWHKSAKSNSGKLESNASFKGLIKKGVILLVVWVAAMLDRVTGSGFVRTAVCLFYIGNEGLSLLENTSIMGVPWPGFIKNMLDVMKQQGDEGNAGSGSEN